MQTGLRRINVEDIEPGMIVGVMTTVDDMGAWSTVMGKVISFEDNLLLLDKPVAYVMVFNERVEPALDIDIAKVNYNETPFVITFQVIGRVNGQASAGRN